MRRAPKYAALATLALIWGVGAAGCVSVPVPPSDMGSLKAGQLGVLQAKVVLAWKPNWLGVTQAALDGFKK